MYCDFLYSLPQKVSPSAQANYLLFEELCLLDIFAYKNCKINKKNLFMYFKSLFTKPNKFHINIYIKQPLNKFLKIAWGAGVVWSLKGAFW